MVRVLIQHALRLLPDFCDGLSVRRIQSNEFRQVGSDTKAIKASEKPEAKLSEITNCFIFTSVELFLPVDALRTSMIVSG
jgi:hypothetical protein